MNVSKARAIIAEFSMYDTYTNAFYDKTNFLPGDRRGNQNNVIEYINYTKNFAQHIDELEFEGVNAWYDLYEEGIIQLYYQPFEDPANPITNSNNTDPEYIPTIGLNSPASRIPKGTWIYQYNEVLDHNTLLLTRPGGIFKVGGNVKKNILPLGAINSAIAKIVDKKADDENPNTGSIRAVNDFYTDAEGNCVDPDDNTKYNAVASDINPPVCSIGMKLTF